jgi:broad specificity phosphatase PhoE
MNAQQTRQRIALILLGAIAAFCSSALVACGTIAAKGDEGGDTRATLRFHLVRHAEKSSDAGKDPGLTEDGAARAELLARLLRDKPIVAVYATDYRRTQATATPTASAHGLAVRTYDAARPATEFAARLRQEHTSGAVLIVGHSNTVAPIASALCGCEVAPLNEQEFDRWIEIEIDAGDGATLRTKRY